MTGAVYVGGASGPGVKFFSASSQHPNLICAPEACPSGLRDRTRPPLGQMSRRSPCVNEYANASDASALDVGHVACAITTCTSPPASEKDPTAASSPMAPVDSSQIVSNSTCASLNVTALMQPCASSAVTHSPCSCSSGVAVEQPKRAAISTVPTTRAAIFSSSSCRSPGRRRSMSSSSAVAAANLARAPGMLPRLPLCGAVSYRRDAPRSRLLAPVATSPRTRNGMSSSDRQRCHAPIWRCSIRSLRRRRTPFAELAWDATHSQRPGQRGSAQFSCVQREAIRESGQAAHVFSHKQEM